VVTTIARALSDVMVRMEAHQHKTTALLRALRSR
jgi:hypothetical protein